VGEAQRIPPSDDPADQAAFEYAAGNADRLRALLSKVPVGIGVLKHRVVVEANDWALRLFGYERGELVGKDTRALFPDQDEYERVGGEFYAEIERTGACELDARFVRKDGELLDVLIRGSWLSANDHSMGVVIAVLDISARKRRTVELESKVQALTSPDADGDSRIGIGDILDLSELQRIQDAFSRATGVASVITDTEGRPITEQSGFCRLCSGIVRKTEKGAAACMRSDAVIGPGTDRGPTMRPCLSAGLLDGGAPITVGGRRIANWLVGQVLDESSDLEPIRRFGQEIGADAADFDDALSSVQRMSSERFKAVCDALYLIAGQISSLAYNNTRQARVIAERDRAEAELRAAIEENQALFRELKHRVKNSMALIAGLVGLEESHSDNAAVREALDNMRSRMESFAVLYELLGGEGSSESVPIRFYLTRVVDSISHSFVSEGRAVFSLDIADASVPARIAAPVGLMVMELATNSLKYAFPGERKGTISVSLRVEEGSRVAFSVSDDGIGLPAGFDPEKDGGLGMELIGMLVKQFKGTWRIAPAAGARVEVEIPLGRSTSGSRPAGA